MIERSHQVRNCVSAPVLASGWFLGNARWSQNLRILAFLTAVVAAEAALARDVSREQSAVEFARQEHEQAAAAHKADTEQAARTGKALESLKKQYAEEQNKARSSAKDEQGAKAKLERARQALDRAWKQ